MLILLLVKIVLTIHHRAMRAGSVRDTKERPLTIIVARRSIGCATKRLMGRMGLFVVKQFVLRGRNFVVVIVFTSIPIESTVVHVRINVLRVRYVQVALVLPLAFLVRFFVATGVSFLKVT